MKRERKRKGVPLHGWLNFYKPLNMTSTQAVGIAKRISGAQKVGHAGTLDPLASGVLPIAFGDATKTVPLLMDATKIYRFCITFGARTDTDDAEGQVVATSEVRPTKEQIEAVLGQFIGSISQMPPAFSALKINGERAYDLARSGQEVVLEARQVRVDSLTLISMQSTDIAELLLVCGKGTYVRSLARDIAHALGSQGHVSRLVREAVGHFTLDDAISLDFLQNSVHIPPASESGLSPRPMWLRPVASVLSDILALEVDGTSAHRLRSGQSVISPQRCEQFGQVAVLHRGELVAMCEASGLTLKPYRVFNG
jgi:tRNA pseudouridine55 synthase